MISQTRLKKNTKYQYPLYSLKRFAANSSIAAKNTAFRASTSRKAIKNWSIRKKRAFI
jgi:hypothetical protein